MSENETIALFDEWNNALQTGNPKNVTALYENDAILLPTISNKVRHNHEEIEDYFVDFLARGPKGKLDESNVRLLGQLRTHSGVCTITFNDGSVVPARFSFLYRWNGERWMIIEHHSSQMPEQQKKL